MAVGCWLLSDWLLAGDELLEDWQHVHLHQLFQDVFLQTNEMQPVLVCKTKRSTENILDILFYLVANI